MLMEISPTQMAAHRSIGVRKRAGRAYLALRTQAIPGHYMANVERRHLDATPPPDWRGGQQVLGISWRRLRASWSEQLPPTSRPSCTMFRHIWAMSLVWWSFMQGGTVRTRKPFPPEDLFGNRTIRESYCALGLAAGPDRCIAHFTL